MKINTLVYGIYPKTNELRLSISRWEKGLLPDAALNDRIDDEKHEFYDRLNNNGILYTDPLFNWYDIFRPLVLITDGMQPGPLTRYKETNTFYRMPEVSEIGGIKYSPDKFTPLNENPPLPLYAEYGKDFNAFLPSPYTFFRMSRVEMAYNDFEKQLLNNYVQILKKFRTKNVVLFDSMPYEKNSVLNLEDFVKEYNVRLITAGNIYKENIRGRPKSIICDNNENNVKIASEISDEPGIKLIDGYNTKLEKPEDIKNEALKYDLDSIIITHTEYFDFLPRMIADKKIEIMSKIGD
ncbi:MULTISPECIES: hypothetical protein [Acidiplasma]|jgi:5-methyltetrahydropteroyltriglutamate--homocysteine methyltransferase|uniref:Uncharacterized protein n=1 Tax=Acidiplasma cupricumulans TaxID=312540 RepID=A0A0Q0RUQ7_9ARCH|nr:MULTISPECIES: hypothetical protein [Acidiplasma]KJE49406.1 hypothetical protein TZ01_05060 [Acidiplasma sp. MBA-1]KQB33726.1 hypothetical protein AOG55_02105 [Acidiplasma cupricumulans]WMT54633.1 MAG: hypothetical protein RE470_06880 [Acidiplasma sp.]